MANPQKEHGYTPIANDIADAMCRLQLSSYETRALWVLFRKTYGWRKKTDIISLSQFTEATGIDRRHIHRALKSLINRHIIVAYRGDRRHIRYGLQKNYDNWILLPIEASKNLFTKNLQVANNSAYRGTISVPVEATKMVPISAHTKAIKETIQKKGTVMIIPEQKEILKKLGYAIASKHKFNIFVFYERMRKNIGKYPPVDAMIKTNEAILKLNTLPKNQYAYITAILKDKDKDYYAELTQKEHKESQGAPTKLGTIMESLIKGGQKP